MLPLNLVGLISLWTSSAAPGGAQDTLRGMSSGNWTITNNLSDVFFLFRPAGRRMG